MLHRDSPFRLLVTVLLAVAVPFCCCDFRSLLGGCHSCEEATPATSQTAEAGHDHADRIDNHGHSPTGDDHHRSDPGNAPEQDQHDCTCGNNTGTMLTVEKSTLELPTPVLVAIPEWSALTDLRPLDLFKGPEVEMRVVERPQTSLLRMHCALIV
ncbi:MAG: hypothetical protein ACK4WH_12095 [Phycisphaerales bacterium]